MLSPHLDVCAMKTSFRSSHDQRSEEFIGEWVEKRGIRDQLVIATKVGVGPLESVMLIKRPVLFKFHARRARSAKKGVLLWKQCEIDAYQRRSEPEEAQDVVH